MFPYAPWLCWIIPIIGAVVTPLIGTIRRKSSSYLAVLSIGLSVCFAFSMIPDILAGQIDPLGIPWRYPELSVLIDPLSVLMACVISCIGFLVTVFSVAYMQEEPSLARFWFLIQLFIGGYLVIVLADNLLFMFIGWETVGICCTGLAAFWHKDPKRAHMGLKTFMVLRIADVLLLASILLIYAYSDPQTLNLTELAQNNTLIGELAKSGMLFITAFMFFGGAIGKAAQFPLQEWLPDALAASPSSFNALTECLAGPFLMARVLPIFHGARGYGDMVNFFLVMALVGALTAVISALIAMAQDNIFKVLSYGISSVIGYMMAAFGLAGLMADISFGYLAGTFLLTVDAFVSALLFLSAAYISYTVGSDNMHHMGGFKSRIAHRSMEVGALALAGIPPLSGFWCTNWIQTVALDFASEAGIFTHMILGYLIFALLIIGAGITAFYGLRMMGLVFRKESYKSDGKGIKKPPSLMPISLTATLVLTAFIDFLAILLIWPFNKFLLPMPFLGQLTFNNITEVLRYIIPSISTVLTCVAVALGGYPAYKIYIMHEADAGRLMEKYSFLKTAHRFLRNRFYIDAFYYKVASSARFFSQKIHNSLEYGLNLLNSFTASRFLSLARITHKYVETEGITKPQIMGFRKFLDTAYRGMAMLSQLAYPRLELGGLEGFNRLIAKTVTNLSEKFRKIQSGVLSYNILAVFAGFILLAILLLLFGGGF
ncbi:MAG: NADH-quinone oxidoreductase subunit L [Candidatus Bathyarchaeota archaeon]|nr:NADH-quinone oxidoreductase subunit L [Candidatus Bathyarchaeota archaeon]MDH5779300.1 NADH-quinone oxidoreductase subunit L [Candidatus Bathyarchaeota archaeon]